MKFGFTIMISKQRVSHPSESCLVLQDRKKQGRWSWIWKSCIPRFSIYVGLFTANAWRKARRSVSAFIWRLWGVCASQWGRIGHRVGKNIVDAASRACSSWQLASDGPVFSIARCHRDTPATVLARLGTLWLFLFWKLKFSLKGRRFQTIAEIQKNSEIDLKAILVSACQECFQKWKRLWQQSVASQGHNFEGNNITSE